MNFRRGTKERWNKLNPVLEDGQPGFERPNGNSSSNKYKLKIGDGHSSWTELPYIGEDGEGGSHVQSDWNQADPTADDYIKNKPTIPPFVNVDQVYDPTLDGANVGVYKELYSSTTAPSSVSGSVAINGSSTVIGVFDIIKVWIYAGSTTNIRQVDIYCKTQEMATVLYYFTTSSSTGSKNIYLSSNGYTLNYATVGSSDSTKISIAKVVGIRYS